MSNLAFQGGQFRTIFTNQAVRPAGTREGVSVIWCAKTRTHPRERDE